MIFIHGTDYDSAMSIVKDGLINGHDTIWTCSRDDMIYCRKQYDDEEDNTFYCIESGQIAAAYKNSMSTKIGILLIDIPDELVEEIVEEDNSCENMYGCYQILISDILDNKDKIKLSMNIHKDAYVPYLRPFYLSNACENYMTIDDQLLQRAIDIIHDSAAYIEDIFYYGEVETHYDL